MSRFQARFRRCEDCDEAFRGSTCPECGQKVPRRWKVRY